MNRIMFIAGAVACSLVCTHAQPARVLLLTGANNHDWQETTPIFEGFLKQSGQFEIETITDPEKMTSDYLSGFDVIFSNWNNWKVNDLVWSEQVKTAYAGFVRNGGGHVVVHAGSSSFYDWDDYFAITLMRWKVGQTSHGPRHEFRIRIEQPGLPAVNGLGTGSMWDELWNDVEIHSNAVVAVSSFSSPEIKKGTGRWEPSVLVGTFGKGRCFSTTLGHNARALQSPYLQQLVVQGLAWAANKDVSKGERQ